MAKQPPERLIAYTDGRCPFCQWSRQQVERYDKERVIEFRDYNQPAIARETPYGDEELATEMHVRAPDGKWYGGFAAWLEVLKALPKWRWLGRLAGYVPFRWVGPWAYRLIARNRYRAPKFLLRWIGAPPPCSQESGCAVPNAS
ncbi:MAG: thiol-disulfide oxidoreductase DCC family protein [Terriglobales bacterium]|jgi:predicted DCC family thiol-disulfide oxidoreductase YuxK